VVSRRPLPTRVALLLWDVGTFLVLLPGVLLFCFAWWLSAPVGGGR
jgi:hypothetical protein